MRLLVATQNQGKQREIARLLETPGLQLYFPNHLPATAELDVLEDGETFAQNAELKARAFAIASDLWTVAEDTGLQVEALAGRPGVASKRWYAGSDTDRNQVLLRRLAGEQNRVAKFVTVACVFDPDNGEAKIFIGELPGSIALDSSGASGFGYDPIFIPTNETHTLAELGIEKKVTISHRAHAFNQVREYLSTRI